ncbi:MAG: response regulator [Gammaproteobacteria bacterium]|nr:response regulator [Gammaproteobacteria bacterium]
MNLRYKLFLPIIISFLGLYVILHSYWAPKLFEYSKQDFIEQMHSELAAIKSDISRHLIANDFSALYSSLEYQQKRHGEIWHHLTLFSPGNKQKYPLFESHEDILSETHGFHIQVDYPIIYNEKDLGKLSLHIDWEQKHLRTLERIQELEGLILVTMFFLLLVNFLTQRQIIIKPLVDLNNATKKMADGDFDTPLHKNNNDEIGQLTENFELMRCNIIRIHASLIDSKNEAIEASRVKSEFLASMSHEIRTPMNGVLGMLSLMQSHELSQEQKQRARIAESSANALLNLINDILDFSKVEAGKLDIEQINFDLTSMLTDFIETMSIPAHKKGIELILDYHNSHNKFIKSDPGRLRQILTNLVSNAIKFTSQGEIKISISIEDIDGQNYRLNGSVSDTGIGIPKEKLSLLFQEFTQVDASTTRKYGGTGLGLSIAKRLSELMGGGVEVSSEEGKGSCFSFNIIVNIANQTESIVPAINMEDLKVLIVEDNATNRDVLRTHIENWGAQVAEAEDAHSALSLCQLQKQHRTHPHFDIALIDMQMPGIDGIELSQQIRKNKDYNSMRLIMMTSANKRGDAKKYAELGFDAYFTKPILAADLFNTFAVIIEGGNAFEQASPLITSHYIHSLNKPEKSINSPKWQDNSENIRILLVEDNRVNQLVAKGFLSKLGLNCDLAANGKEAIESLLQAPAESTYDLILMDCQMPEMDGYEATKQIRAGKAGSKNTDITIVAMTANAMKGDKEKCFDAGMNEYISKPVSKDKLSHILNQWLDH